MEWQTQDGHGLEDRKKAFEAKFRLDEEVAFKVNARRTNLLGRWAAERMSLPADDVDAYARSLVEADLLVPGHAGLFAKLRHDFDAKGIAVSDDEIRAAVERLHTVAREQVLADLGTQSKQGG